MLLAIAIGLGLTVSVLGVAQAANGSGEPLRVALQETEPPVETPVAVPLLDSPGQPTEVISPTQTVAPEETLAVEEPLEEPGGEEPGGSPETETPQGEGSQAGEPESGAPQMEATPEAGPGVLPEIPLVMPPVQDPLPINQPQALAAGDLQVHTSMSPDTVHPGGTLTITIRYTNTLAGDANNVVISNTLSKAQTFDGIYSSSPDIPTGQFSSSGSSASGYRLLWTGLSIPGNTTGWIIFHTTVLTTQPDLVDDPILPGNAVNIYSNGYTKLEDTSNANSMVVGPNLKLRMAGSPTSVLPGRLLTYTLTLENKVRADCLAATNIVVTDTLPLDTSFVSAQEGSYDDTTKIIRFDIPGPLACNTSVTRKFVVRVSDQVSSDDSISNGRSAYKVTSTELIGWRRGSENISTPVNPVLVKTARDKDGGSVSVFPTQEVTYTITVINPLMDTPLSGVIVTDTMPGNPVPFTFVRATPGSPVPTILSGGKLLVWTGINLPAGGSTTFSFVVQIPRETTTGTQPDDSFSNALEATHPTTYFSSETGLAKVVVKAALWMTKSVSPGSVLDGDEVIYKLLLQNRGPFDFTSVRVTDTLPMTFTYARMDYGDAPMPAYQTNPIVWDGLYIPMGATMELRFVVKAEGEWLEKHYNNVRAYSADGYIPPELKAAPVTILSPVTVNKSVDNSTVFLKDFVNYSVGVYNRDDENWVLTEFNDTLPPGFYEVGSNSNTVVKSLGSVVVPSGDTWTTEFQAQVVTAACANLPKKYYNATGNIALHLTAPIDIWAFNAANLAPVTVIPNINVTLIPYRRAVEPGSTVDYTLKMENISPYAAYDSLLTLTLPSGFTYQSMLQGPNPGVSGSQLTWSGVNIQPAEAVTFIFRVLVADTVTPEKSYSAKFSGTAPNVCFGSMESTSVLVTEHVVVLDKDGPTAVGSLARFTYELKIRNKDAYPIVLTSLVDTLPTDFAYEAVASGPAPTSVQDGVITWNDLTLAPGTTTIKLVARSANLYRTYWNNLAATSPGLDILAINDAPVTVLPVVDIKKETRPDYYLIRSRVPYTITVINLSGLTYSNIVITDTLPTGFTFGQMRKGPAPVVIGATPAWKITSMKPNAVVYIGFDAVIGDSAALGMTYNEVSAYSPTGAIPPTGLTAPITVTAMPSMDLKKETRPGDYAVGTYVPYTITVTNSTGATFNDIAITDTLPGGFTFGQVRSGPAPVVTGAKPVWKIASMQPGAVVSIAFNAFIGEGAAPGVTYNQVSAASLTGAVPSTGPTAPVNVTALPALAIKTETRAGDYPVGSYVPYTITVHNPSGLAYSNVVITDTLPGEFTFARLRTGPTPTATGVRPVWKLVSLQPGMTLTIGFDALIGAGAAQGVNYNQVLAYSPTGATPSTGPAAPVNVTALPALNIKKETRSGDYLIGSYVPYTITAVNSSGLAYTSIVITDTLPDGFVFGQMRKGPAPTASGAKPVWKIASVQPGASAIIIFDAIIGGSAVQGVNYNQVSAYSPTGVTPATGPTAPVTVMPVSAMEIKKETRSGDYLIGSSVPYTITVTNPSGLTFHDIVITDTLPGGFTFAQLRKGPVPTVTGTKPVWKIASLAPGASVSISFDSVIGEAARTGLTYNQVFAYSPSGVIPPTGLTAPVNVTVPGPTNPVMSLYLPVARK